MGILHKLVFLLGKLDPRNAQWRQRQIDRVQNTIREAEKIDDSVAKAQLTNWSGRLRASTKRLNATHSTTAENSIS